MPDTFAPFQVRSVGNDSHWFSHDPTKVRVAHAFQYGRPAIHLGGDQGMPQVDYKVSYPEFEFRLKRRGSGKPNFVDIVFFCERQTDYRDARTQWSWPPVLLYGLEVETRISSSGAVHRYLKEREARLQAWTKRENRKSVLSGLSPEFTSRMSLAVPKRDPLLPDLALELKANQSFFAYEGVNLWEVFGLGGDLSAKVKFKPVTHDPFADMLFDADTDNDEVRSSTVH